MDTVNIYTTKDCPKCKILLNLCEKSNKLKNTDYQIIEIDTSDTTDTNFQLLVENNITMLPVILINNDFLDFNDSILWLREE